MKIHVGLRVREIVRSIDFYAALLGVEPGKLRPDYARFEVEGLVLGLSQDAGVRPGHGAAHHFGFRVADAAAFEAAR
ncbi:MAG: VOC family protein, partial [Planctomycetota bacterium JB042]